MIYLRKLTNEDLDYLISIENDKAFWKYSFNNQIYSKEQLQSLIKDSYLDINITNQIRYVMCNVTNNERLGFVDLFDIDFENSRAGLGILIANKKNRNKGYGKIALRKIIKIASEKLKINNLYCNISRDNMQSINCFKSVGFLEIDNNSDIYISSTEIIDSKSIIQLQCI